MKNRNIFKDFTRTEVLLLVLSVLTIIAVFCIFDRTNYLALTASLIGVVSLIFNAKGNPLGQLLILIFCVLYGIISLSYAYYGEMITYLGMTAPMAFISLITWLKHPYNGKKSEVQINSIHKKEIFVMFLLAAIVTVVFYFILKAFNTNNIIPSTISVTTSFVAAYLTYRRSPYFAIAYALNDIVLIILWTLASIENLSYLSVLCCFSVFLINDLYAFFNWLRIQKRQTSDTTTKKLID